MSAIPNASPDAPAVVDSRAAALQLPSRGAIGQRRLRVLLFMTHPVQYHVPLWRGLAAQPELDIKVFYFSDQGVAKRTDPGFGVEVAWDVPLLEGYESQFLSKAPIAEVPRVRIRGLDALMRAERPAVVMLHGYTHAFARQLARARRKYRFRLLLRGEFTDAVRLNASWYKSLLRNLYLRWFYRRVDHFCPIGKDAVDHLVRRGIKQTAITVTPYSVDDHLIDRQRKEFSRKESRVELAINEDQVLFLFSGKLIARKQPLLLADAIADLATDRRVCIAYLGAGPLFGEVEAKLRPLLGERLIMPGFVNQSQLGGYFAAADVFVLPTAYDTWGLVVNEAMHWGLPCVVSNSTGCRRDLVIEGRTGYVHAWDSASELSDILARFLEEPELAPNMGLAARKHIEGWRSQVVVERLRYAVKIASEGCWN